jgi:hypothetical protein
LTLWSDTPGARLLARWGLSYKARLKSALHLLAQWENRSHESEDGSKVEVDTSEPGFASLLASTRAALNNDGDVDAIILPLRLLDAENLPSM